MRYLCLVFLSMFVLWGCSKIVSSKYKDYGRGFDVDVYPDSVFSYDKLPLQRRRVSNIKLTYQITSIFGDHEMKLSDSLLSISGKFLTLKELYNSTLNTDTVYYSDRVQLSSAYKVTTKNAVYMLFYIQPSVWFSSLVPQKPIIVYLLNDTVEIETSLPFQMSNTYFCLGTLKDSMDGFFSFNPFEWESEYKYMYPRTTKRFSIDSNNYYKLTPIPGGLYFHVLNKN